MAARNFSLQCIILQTRESSSGGRIVSLLSAEEGILQAFMFGGGKSKLRSLASPWHAGTAWLSRDKSDFIKLTDFDPIVEFSSIRGNLEAIAVASLLSEVLGATHCLGGDYAEAYQLALLVLQNLDTPGQSAAAVLLQFCIQLLESMGLLSDTAECGQCGCQLAPRAARFYSHGQGNFVCARCAGRSDNVFATAPAAADSSADNYGGESGYANTTAAGYMAVPAGAIVWLERCRERGFQEALGIGLAAESGALIRSCLLDMLLRSVPAPLRSLSLLAVF